MSGPLRKCQRREDDGVETEVETWDGSRDLCTFWDRGFTLNRGANFRTAPQPVP